MMNREGLTESNIESMDIGFKVRTLVLKGIELSLAGIASPPRSRNDSVLNTIDGNDVVRGWLKGFEACVVVFGNGGVRRREEARRVEEVWWEFKD